MILGQSANRMADFTRPQDAGFYQPKLASTQFLSHFQPFRNVMLPMASFRPNLPSMPGMMRPIPQPMAPYAPATNQLAPQLRVSGFGQAGSPFAFLETDPSRSMRSGQWLAVTPQTVRQGVTQAGQFMQRQSTGYGPGFRPAGQF